MRRDEMTQLLQEAQDPQTHPARLIELVNQRDPSLEPLLAKNPNLPKEQIFALAARYPKEVLENPALSIMLLESDTAQHITLDALTTLTTTDEAPAEMLKALLGLSILSLQARLAETTQVPQVLAWLAVSADTKTREAVARNQQSGGETLCSLAKDTEEKVRSEVAKNAKTPCEALESLSHEINRGVLLGLAQNPSTPANLLAQICEVERPWGFSVRYEASKHQHMRPPNINTQLRRCSTHSPRINTRK
jgi:hypothetical protein